jgi:hypothetical protein
MYVVNRKMNGNHRTALPQKLDMITHALIRNMSNIIDDFNNSVV